MFHSTDLSKLIVLSGRALVEKFVDGREFSVLIAGDKFRSYVYPPVECVFKPERAQAAFITFEDKVSLDLNLVFTRFIWPPKSLDVFSLQSCRQ